jgi:hypothetical protein
LQKLHLEPERIQRKRVDLRKQHNLERENFKTTKIQQVLEHLQEKRKWKWVPSDKPEVQKFMEMDDPKGKRALERRYGI